MPRMTMPFRNENFALGHWFNNHEETLNDAKVNSKYEEPIEIVSLVEEQEETTTKSCIVCHATNGSLMKSTTGNKGSLTSIVYVCSKKCEKKHLQMSKKRSPIKSRVIVEDDTVCFVCQAPDPEFLSTKNTTKDAPSVPVCSLTCEEEYLDNRGLHLTKKPKRTSTKKRSKKSEEDDENDDEDFEMYDPNPRQQQQDDHHFDDDDDMEDEEYTDAKKKYRESLKLLRDTLVEETAEEEGYTSWWSGALAFYDYVYQRHGMWHIYAMGNMHPNVDPGLTKFWTWNIYRELDRSTCFLRKHVLRWQQAHHGRLSLREVLWMSICFRMCNKLETFDQVMGIIPSTNSYEKFKKKTLQHVKKLGKQPQEEMFMPYPRNSSNPALKIQSLTVDNYLEYLDFVLDHLDEITIQVRQSTTLEGIQQALLAFNSTTINQKMKMTPFISWQITVDLMEVNLLSRENLTDYDTYVWLSPEAIKSLVQIFGKRRARSNELLSLTKLLEQRQVQAFNCLKVVFPYFMDRPLNLKNIAHALHGFQTYCQMKLLESGKLSRSKKRPEPYKSRSYLNDKEYCEICSKTENDDQLVLCDLCNRMFHSYCLGMEELPPASWVCEPCQDLCDCPQEGLATE